MIHDITTVKAADAVRRTELRRSWRSAHEHPLTRSFTRVLRRPTPQTWE